MRGRVAAAAVVVLTAAAGAAQDRPLTRNPLRSFEDVLVVYCEAEVAIAQAKAGRGHWERGEFEAARRCFEDSLAVIRKHFPDDSPLVGQCHGMLATYYEAVGDPAAAEPHARAHVATARSVPKGLFLFTPTLVDQNLSLALNNLAMVREGRGDLAEADRLLREALAVRRKLYPGPEPNFDVAVTLGNLALVEARRGELEAAEAHANEAYALLLKLFDGKSHPISDPGALPRAMNNVAETMRLRGRDEAEVARLQDMAIELRRQNYPGGHPELAIDLRNRAIALADRGDYTAAAGLLTEARQMLGRLYPAARFPNGHPRSALVLRDSALVEARVGDRAAAGRFAADALAMAEALFPDAAHPDGHPAVSAGLTAVGTVQFLDAKTADAALAFREALARTTRFGAAQADRLAEAEGLNLVRAEAGPLDGLLSATAGGPFDPRDYQFVWTSKAAVGRAMERRRLALLGTRDPATLAAARELENVRTQLSAMLFTPDAAGPAAALTARKEQLERDLSDRLKLPQGAAAHPFALAAALPPGAAFVDLLAYVRYAPDAGGRRREAHYAAFVLARGRLPERVELGPAGPIRAAVADWLRAITAPAGAGADERAGAAAVGRLVWDRIAPHLPPSAVSVDILCVGLATPTLRG